MSKVTVTVSSKIQAPAAIVYSILADYNHHHPNILPLKFFIGLDVIEGGMGEGTRFTLHAKSLGGQTQMHMAVTEPKPGSVLVERDENKDLMTMFTVEAIETPARETAVCNVTFKTVWQPEPGLKGLIDRWTTPFLMRMVYREEMKILDEYAQKQV